MVELELLSEKQSSEWTTEQKFPPTDEWINQMKYNHTMEYYSVKKKKWSTYACNSVDKAELSKYYTKWKKPVHSIKCPEQTNL